MSVFKVSQSCPIMRCWAGARDGSTAKQGTREDAAPIAGARQRALVERRREKFHGTAQVRCRERGKMADNDANEPADGFDELAESQDELVATPATVAVVGAGVIVFEAALLPGLVLGIATMLVPKYLPRLGGAVSPLVKSTVRGAYKMGQKTREMVAEVQEHMHDIVAEVDAEGDKKAAT